MGRPNDPVAMVCGQMVYGAWALDHGRPGYAPCAKPAGHEGDHDADWIDTRPKRNLRSLVDRRDEALRTGAPDEVIGTLDAEIAKEKTEVLGSPTNMAEEKNDPEGVLRNFIASHILAMRMVSVGSNSYRHEPQNCKHCEALQALEDLVAGRVDADHVSQLNDIIAVQQDKLDELRGNLATMTEIADDANIALGKVFTEKEEVERNLERTEAVVTYLQGEVGRLIEERNDALLDARQCHTTKQHELGTMCANYVTALEKVLKHLRDDDPKSWAEDVIMDVLGHKQKKIPSDSPLP